MNNQTPSSPAPERIRRLPRRRIAQLKAARSLDEPPLGAFAQAAATVRRLRELETLEQRAAEVAHDCNNVLTAVTLHRDLLQADPRLATGLRPELAEVAGQANRAVRLLRRLLDRREEETDLLAPLQLNDLVANLRPLLASLMGPRLELVFELDPDLPVIAGCAGALEQIVLNLCLNARDATVGGGRIYVATSTASPAPEVLGEGFHLEIPAPLSACPSPTRVAAWTKRRAVESSSRTSPRNPPAREPGWVWRRFSAPSASTEGGSRSRARWGADRFFRVYLPAPDRG